jgi:hypothetical protein
MTSTSVATRYSGIPVRKSIWPCRSLSSPFSLGGHCLVTDALFHIDAKVALEDLSR